MTIQVGLASSADELDALYQVRHHVYVDEMGYFPSSPDGRLVDRWDPLATTGNFVARIDGRVVGGARATLYDPDIGSPVGDLFDFGPHVPANANVAIAGMLAMEPEGRATPHLTFVTLAAMYHWCILQGVTHVAAVAAPAAEQAVLASGFRSLAERARHPESGLLIRPFLLDVTELAGRFRSFVERQRLPVTVPLLTRQLHGPGTPILRAGDAGDAAYVVLDGEVEVRADDGSPLARLAPGELFGEVAPLTGRARTRDVVACGSVELLVVPRAELRHAMSTRRPFADDLRATMARRTGFALAA